MASASLNVLVVDDERVNRDVISRHLGGCGHHMRTAEGGFDALKAVAEKCPDVMILDLTMPDMDGLDVCRKLRQDYRTRGLPVIVMTARMTPEDRLAGYRAGVDDYLTKPFDLDELSVRLEAAIERRRWDQETHPLTHLPGSLHLEGHVRRKLAEKAPFAFAYIDIDHFKSFNDAYGYDAGDHIIKAVADLVMQAAEQSGDCMPAHIGGDDFVLVGSPVFLHAALPRIATQFDLLRLPFYSAEARARGGLEIKNRQGLKQFFPLMALSIAAVPTETRPAAHYARLVEIASELKGFIKTRKEQQASMVLWDRRIGV